MATEEGYRIAKEFAEKVMKLAEETAANQTIFNVKELLERAKIINSATLARTKIKKHTSWNMALQDMKNKVEKHDRDPTHEMTNGRKAFTGNYQKLVKETYHANKEHYQALADQHNAEVEAGEPQALIKSQERAIRQLRKFVSTTRRISTGWRS
jgi:hypothetical protein